MCNKLILRYLRKDKTHLYSLILACDMLQETLQLAYETVLKISASLLDLTSKQIIIPSQHSKTSMPLKFEPYDVSCCRWSLRVWRSRSTLICAVVGTSSTALWSSSHWSTWSSLSLPPLVHASSAFSASFDCSELSNRSGTIHYPLSHLSFIVRCFC